MQLILAKDSHAVAAGHPFHDAERVPDTAAADLAEATYLIIQPIGEVSSDEGSEQYAPLSPLECTVWTILAGFPARPPMMLADYARIDRDAAIGSVLAIAEDRPIWYLTDSELHKIQARSLEGVIAELDEVDECFADFEESFAEDD